MIMITMLFTLSLFMLSGAWLDTILTARAQSVQVEPKQYVWACITFVAGLGMMLILVGQSMKYCA